MTLAHSQRACRRSASGSGEICLSPSLAATLQPSPCPGGPFPAQISKAKLLLAVSSMAAHLSALCPPSLLGAQRQSPEGSFGSPPGEQICLVWEEGITLTIEPAF